MNEYSVRELEVVGLPEITKFRTFFVSVSEMDGTSCSPSGISGVNVIVGSGLFQVAPSVRVKL